jgi:tetratricopeptide (TPR) repeat protein
MSDLHRRRSHSLCLLLTLAVVVCGHTTLFAATSESSPSAADITIPTSNNSLTPEIQGDLLMVRRSYAAALDAYQREPNRSAVLINKIGVAYHHMFALDKARQYYQQALSMKPDYAEAMNNLAAIYHGQHDYRQAEKMYKLALRSSPNSAILYCNLGTSYFAEEKYKAGMDAYNKALSLNPHIFDAGQTQIVEETTTRRQLVAVNFYLARTYATSGKLQESIVYLRKAIENGFRDQKLLMKDKDFAVLRSTPEFHQLMHDEGVRE